MNEHNPPHAPTLIGQTIELRPLTEIDGPALLSAAADGQLWNMNMTVIPGPETVDLYIEKAIEGQRSGSVMPFVSDELNEKSRTAILRIGCHPGGHRAS